MHWKGYQILLLLVQVEQEQGLVFISKVKKQLSEAVREKQLGIVFSRDPYIGILLNSSFDRDSKLQRLNEEIAAVLRIYQLEYSAAIGESVVSITEVTGSYDTAVELMNYKFFFEKDRIIHTMMVSELKRQLSDECFSEAFNMNPYIDKLLYSLDIGDKEKAAQILEQIGTEMLYFNMTEHVMKSNYVKIVMGVVNKLIQLHSDLRSLGQESTAWVEDIYTVKHNSIAEVDSTPL
jgi:two-component system response regulator YesN